MARDAMVGNKGIGPITFAACSSVVSTLIIYIVMPCMQRAFHVQVDPKENGRFGEPPKPSTRCELLFWGFVCGCANFSGSVLGQIGLVTVTVGKAGFITGMYVVFIPLVEYILPGYGIKLSYKSWIAAAVCLVGLYLISGCAEDDVCIGGAIKQGEILLMLSMLSWIVTIMAGDAAAKNLDVIALTYVDFITCTALGIAVAVWREPHNWQYPYNDILNNWWIILITALFESLASPLCTMGQMYVAPTRASLLMSLESVWCVVLGFFCLQETLSYSELLGCTLMFTATLVSTVEQDDGDTLRMEMRSPRVRRNSNNSGNSSKRSSKRKDTPKKGHSRVSSEDTSLRAVSCNEWRDGESSGSESSPLTASEEGNRNKGLGYLSIE